MQVLKKFVFLFVGILLAGCQSSAPSLQSRGGTYPYGDKFQLSPTVNLIDDSAQDGMFRVGMLLPLSGSAAKYGQGLKNAALLAVDDVKSDKLVVQFYDTQSTPSGARVAIENALNQGSKLILGPLMSSSVKAIEEKTSDANVPVIAFSTNPDILQAQVYTLGLLVNEQVDTMISYAAQQGRSKFALLIPDDDTGIAIAKAAVMSTQKNGVSLTNIAFYQPNTTDFSTSVKALTDYQNRRQRLEKVKRSLTAQANAGDQNAKLALNKLGRAQALGDVEFDAVIIPATGAQLKSALSMFGYYDVFSPKVQFLGTAVWESTDLTRETMAQGAWFPAMSKTHSAYFAKKYADAFGQKPAAIYSLAYDAVALSASLAKKNPADINYYITSPDGYVGINGIFRIFPNGLNEHSLDIYEVTSQGNKVVQQAPQQFSAGLNDFASDVAIENNYAAPIISGKDMRAAEMAIYGRVLDRSFSSYSVDEMDVIRKALKEKNVIVE